MFLSYIVLVLVANKADLNDGREVTDEEGRDLANKLNALYFTISSLTNMNVQELFDGIETFYLDEYDNKNRNYKETLSVFFHGGQNILFIHRKKINKKEKQKRHCIQ